MTIKQEIIQDLKYFHSGKWVSELCAIRKHLSSDGFAALKSLAADGIIERSKIGGFPYVRYTPPIRNLKLVEK